MKNNLTKKYMWESKWGNDALPIKLDSSIKSNQSFIDIFNQYFILHNIDNPTVLAIINYFAIKLSYGISGIVIATSMVFLINTFMMLLI